MAVIDDLMVHMPNDYQKTKCSPQETKLLKEIDRYQPNVIVVGLKTETRESIYPFGILKDWNEYANIPIIVVGGEDDCDLFRKIVFQKHMEIFVRPIKMEVFTETLTGFLKLSEELMKYKEKETEAAPSLAETKIKQVPKLESTAQNDGAAQEQAIQEQAALEKKLREKYDLVQSDRKSVLVVDDDVRMLNVIKMHLMGMYDVTIVPSGKLALKFLEKKKADLVLLDYMMPEQSGPEVLRAIRENSPCPDIPVVFLTGVSEREKVMVGLEFRPAGYLLKPVEPSVLLEKVTEVILGL